MQARAIRRELCEATHVLADLAVLVKFAEEIGGARTELESHCFGRGGGLDIGNQDLPRHARDLELVERIGIDDDVEWQAGTAVLAPDVERAGFGERAGDFTRAIDANRDVLWRSRVEHHQGGDRRSGERDADGRTHTSSNSHMHAAGHVRSIARVAPGDS